MKISANKSNPSVNFTSTPLYKVNVVKVLQNGIKKEVPAYFSELSFKDPKDIAAMDELLKKWGEAAEYIKGIHLNFSMKLPDCKTYAVELEGKEPLAERVLSLSSIREFSKESLWGEFLQTRRDLKAVDQEGTKVKTRKFKGAGELSVYGAIRKATEGGFEHFDFESVNDRFYEAIKLFEVGIGCDIRLRCIYPRKMREFLERVETEYKFEKINPQLTQQYLSRQLV